MTTRYPPSIEQLSVKNYRVLRDVTLADLTPLSVLIGPNGSGKSTVFDVFAFLSECLANGLRKAWEKRGRFEQLRSRGESGPIDIKIRYREGYDDAPPTPITYHLQFDEVDGRLTITKETLRYTRGKVGKPFKFMDFSMGRGLVSYGATSADEVAKDRKRLRSPDVLALSALGDFEENPRIAALKRYVEDWHLSYLQAEELRRIAEAGGEERLSRLGTNLPNVIQHLTDHQGDRLLNVFRMLTDRIRHLDKVEPTKTVDGRLVLEFKDKAFASPILASRVSDGTLKLLAYLVLLSDLNPPQLIGIEEPENFLDPRLMSGLAEECLEASARTQIIVATHSPFFLRPLAPEQVRVIERGLDGFARVVPLKSVKSLKSHIKQGAKLDELWMEGHFDSTDRLDAAAE